MQRWEYLQTTECETERLNELGADGWELVAVTTPTTFVGRAFYFKRPVQQQSISPRIHADTASGPEPVTGGAIAAAAAEPPRRRR